MYRHRVFLASFISHCYTCIKTWVEREILSSTILEKLSDFLEFERYAVGYIFDIEFIASCIVIHNKSLLLDDSQHYLQCITYAAILQIVLLFSMIWYCRIQSPVVSKERDVRWCGFRKSISLSIDYVWTSCIDMAISILSCSYCIYNKYWQIHRSILPIF